MPNAPEMTPEMYAELSGQQPPTPEQQPDPTQVPPQQPPPTTPMPEQQPQPQGGDDIAQAREMLGIDQTEASIGQLQEQLSMMQQDRVKAQLSSKYPDIPYDVVEKEIEKVAAINPAFADSMKTTPEGMDMAYRAAQSAIKPQEKPDNLTVGEGGGGQGESLEENVRAGSANDIDLGDYILDQKV